MNQAGIKLYLMAIIIVIITINIPEIATPLREKLTVLQPSVEKVLIASYTDISVAVLPLVGRIGGVPKLVVNGQAVKVDAEDSMSLTHGQSLTIEQIDKILSEAGSPATGTGKNWIDAGTKYNIDAAYPLAIFYYESGFATNKEWAGYKDNGTHTYNIGNMICAGYTKCYGAFRDYSDWDNPWWAGIMDNTRLLSEYRDKDGIKTFGDAIMKWAPPSENDTQKYIAGAEGMIRAWRNTNRIALSGKAQAVSAPITINRNDSFGFNVSQALQARNNALQDVIIKDGERWSFNATIGKADMELRTIYGIPGGGWCDLACRYVQVLKGLGLHITHGTDMSSDDIVFLQHGGMALYNCSVDESPYIWSAGNVGFENGMQDLIVNNRTGKTIHLTVVNNNDGTATITGTLE